MLRTLAINSNQIVLSFGVLIAFLSPKQSEIEESSLESISKSRIQEVWDPAHSTRTGNHSHSIRVGITPDWRHYTRLTPLHPTTSLTPGYRHYTRLPPHSTRMFTSRILTTGRERRAFELPRSHISRSAYSAYPESFATILHSATMFSWSFPICVTDILRYFEIFCFRYFGIFCFRYLMSKSPNSPCSPPIIGFLSYEVWKKDE